MRVNTVRILLISGLIVPLLFWGSILVSASMQVNYNHFRDTVSALGAIGSPSEKLMAILTWGCTAFSITFLVGLSVVCQQLKLNKTPLTGIVGAIVMFAWAATFHSGNPMHPKAGPALLLLLLGPLLSVILWKEVKLKPLRKFGILSFVMMLMVLLRAIPSETLQYNFTGLIQRFVHFGWSVWFVSLSLTFLKLKNDGIN
ncbi:DUF998 domain-containing protein [Pedobacter sp. AW31-3R]|uniref:DUF998 domain-containing protein n=1 Tax=Pedobacter sp. AW31-3R TaxID=3445781 RepID=UPI003F9EFA54